MKHVNIKQPEHQAETKTQCERSWQGYPRKFQPPLVYVVCLVCTVRACVLLRTILCSLEACGSSGPFYWNVKLYMQMWEEDRVKNVKTTHVVNISPFYLWHTQIFLNSDGHCSSYKSETLWNSFHFPCIHVFLSTPPSRVIFTARSMHLSFQMGAMQWFAIHSLKFICNGCRMKTTAATMTFNSMLFNIKWGCSNKYWNVGLTLFQLTKCSYVETIKIPDKLCGLLACSPNNLWLEYNTTSFW